MSDKKTEWVNTIFMQVITMYIGYIISENGVNEEIEVCRSIYEILKNAKV